MSRTWIPRDEALERLKVKPQTLYAYVSRGRVAARPDPADPRRSLYAAADVARLLDRSAPPPQAPSMAGSAVSRGEAVLESALTAVTKTAVLYRGRDAVALSAEATAEQVARLLWGGEDDPFADQKPRPDVVFPGGPKARLFAALARRAEEDSATGGRSAASLRREAASLLNEAVDAVAGGGPRLWLHQRLARGWKHQSERDAHLIRRTLVLAADHEMNEATLAVRVAASTGASLAACVLTGLCALSGSRLGGRVAAAQAFLGEVRRGADPRAAARMRLAQGLDLPGFGHGLYPDGDPRARALIAAAEPPLEVLDLLQVGEGLTGQAPNFDMALAVVARRLDLPRDGGVALYAIGRSVGWLAHALEQIASGSPVRARLRYVGPEPERA